jgi:hypothetical protein
MKTWRVLRTDAATWQGTGQEYELRWQAEDAYQAAKAPGVIVTMAEFVNGKMIEIVKDSRFEIKENVK